MYFISFHQVQVYSFYAFIGKDINYIQHPWSLIFSHPMWRSVLEHTKKVTKLQFFSSIYVVVTSVPSCKRDEGKENQIRKMAAGVSLPALKLLVFRYLKIKSLLKKGRPESPSGISCTAVFAFVFFIPASSSPLFLRLYGERYKLSSTPVRSYVQLSRMWIGGTPYQTSEKLYFFSLILGQLTYLWDLHFEENMYSFLFQFFQIILQKGWFQ